MDIKKWFKNQAVGITFAMSSVEKNAFSQKGDDLTKTINQEQRHNQGTLVDSLINGVVTSEVEALRWRTYKILQAAQAYSAKITYDENGNKLTTYVKYNKQNVLNKIKIDSFDDYKLEMVIDNEPITLSGLESMDDNSIILTDEPIKNYDANGNITSATHGEINGINSYINKNERPIIIGRESLPKFQIEDFTKKLNIRIINENERLLEFYISMYPDMDNRTTRLLISDIKKAIEAPRNSNMLNIKTVEFISYNSIGVNDFLEYKYDIISFDKIVEFNGFYIIKFKANIITNGLNILEEYRVNTLDIKYETKERRKN